MIPLLLTASLLAAPRETWSADVVLETGTKLGGCAVGDVDPRSAGNEIVACAVDGKVHLARREAEGWTSEVIYEAGGEMIQLAIGDADPRTPGDEILLVGVLEGTEDDASEGACHIVRWKGDGFVGELVRTTPKLLHGVAIGDGRFYLCGFDGKAWSYRPGLKGWESASVDLPAAGKAALAVSGGVMVACTDGSLVRVGAKGAEVVDVREAGRSRLGRSGKIVACSDDDGALGLITLAEEGTGFEREIVYRSEDKLRGAVVADLLPSREGPELATAGYDGKVVLVREGDDGWTSQVLWTDTAKLHHLASGELDGRPGAELVACGYSGRLVALRLQPE